MLNDFFSEDANIASIIAAPVFFLLIFLCFNEFKNTLKEISKNSGSSFDVHHFLAILRSSIVLIFLILIFALLVAIIFKSFPLDSETFRGYVNDYSTGLSLLFSIPISLAGSLVAILLALRAIKGADDTNQLFKDQLYFEVKSKIIDEASDIHKNIFGLADSLISYISVTRKIANKKLLFGTNHVNCVFWETEINQDLFNEFVSSRNNVISRMKKIVYSPQSSKFWKYIILKYKSSVIEFLWDVPYARSYSRMSIDDIPSIIMNLESYNNLNTFEDMNEYLDNELLDYMVLDYIRRTSFKNSVDLYVRASCTISTVIFDEPKPKNWHIKELLTSGWSYSTYISYVLNHYEDKIDILNKEQIVDFLELIISGLTFVPESIIDFKEFLYRFSKNINDFFNDTLLDSNDWYKLIEDSALQDVGRFDENDEIERSLLIFSGALLANNSTFNFHNIGVAVLIDVINIISNDNNLEQYIKDTYSKEYESIIESNKQRKLLDLETPKLLPEGLTKASEWLKDHSLLALTTPFSLCKDDELDKKFTNLKWDDLDIDNCDEMHDVLDELQVIGCAFNKDEIEYIASRIANE